MLNLLLLFLILFIQYINPYIIKNIGRTNNLNNNKSTKIAGYDQRFPKTQNDSISIENILIRNITQNYLRYNLINKLKDPNLNQISKLEIIDEVFPKNEIKPNSILNGGLLNDFLY